MASTKIAIQDTPSGRLLARAMRIMGERVCTMGEAMDLARAEGDSHMTDAERVAHARRAQAAAMDRAFPGCGPLDGSDL